MQCTIVQHRSWIRFCAFAVFAVIFPSSIVVTFPIVKILFSNVIETCLFQSFSGSCSSSTSSFVCPIKYCISISNMAAAGGCQRCHEICNSDSRLLWAQVQVQLVQVQERCNQLTTDVNTNQFLHVLRWPCPSERCYGYQRHYLHKCKNVKNRDGSGR